MNANRLLTHFERISDAPDAVDRLRRFILDLAVRGKLVKQDAKEGNATDLLDMRTGSGKQALVAKGVRRAFEEGERWCAIPANWAFMRLGEISTVVMGSSPPGSSYNREGEGVPLINGPVEFSPGAFGRTVINQHTTEPTAFCDEGDFLICVRGSTTGRTNISSCRACIGRGVAAIQCHFTDTYIRHAICLQREKILAMGRGIAFPSISRDQLLNLALPLPPLAEQKRIVEKVDELMMLCDRLEASQAERESRRNRLVVASLNRLSQPTNPDEFKKDARFQLSNLNRFSTKPEHIKELRKAILNLAVKGKLVPQDEKEDRNPSATGATVAEPPHPLPSGWGWVPLEHILAFGPQNGLSPKPTEREDAPKAITLTATTSGVFLAGHYKRVEASLPPESELWLRAGDLLFQRGNTREYVGIAAIYNGPPNEFIYPDLMIKVRVVPEAYMRFIHLAAIAPPARSYFSTYATGAQASMPKINHSILRQLPIPLPPLAEQKRIVAKVDELMLICDQLENQLETQHKGRRQLLEALLHEALERVV